MTKSQTILNIKILYDLLYEEKILLIEKIISESEVDVFEDEDILEALLEYEDILRMFYAINKRLNVKIQPSKAT
jgi:hypothetical protein